MLKGVSVDAEVMTAQKWVETLQALKRLYLTSRLSSGRLHLVLPLLPHMVRIH